ncbi:MAG: aspartate-semialdehyde dehydrogenase [Bacteroidetes bacterium CG2_30_33_31]|nr:MAG: aspartate-semialdehyde dehydrogenase [Bacteroidetes bacterium CG2_30_33_31]
MKIAIVGATGMVGRVMLKVLEERNINAESLIFAASEKSVGTKIEYFGNNYTVVSVENAIEAMPQIAIFSAGGEASKKYAPEFAKNNCFVIDNSSAWRMDENVPLVVPEINADKITNTTRIIANPNCSTIQMVLALWPLQRHYGLDRVVVSTYQSVTGSGVKGLEQLMNERANINGIRAYAHRIDLNLLPHAGDFLPNAYTTEEMKLVYETRKILNDNDIKITATVVRVPVKGGHSESINIRLKNSFEIADIKRLIRAAPGIKLHDEPFDNIYPMPYYAEGKDFVYVGRLRIDESEPNSLNMWVVSDNLRKGAATNAIQIAEFIIEKFF